MLSLRPAASLILVLLLAGCGGTEDGDVSAPATNETAEDATAPEDTAPESTDTGDDAFDEAAEDEPTDDQTVIGDPGSEDGLSPVEPSEVDVQPGGTVDPRPVPVQRVEASDDGTTLTVHVTKGVEPCAVVDDVEVETSEDQVGLTVLVGRSATAREDVVCTQQLVEVAVEVALDEPLHGREVVDLGSGGTSVDDGA